MRKRWLSRLLCWCGRHDLVFIQHLSERSWRCGCSRCDREWAVNEEMQVMVPWTPAFENFYRLRMKTDIIRPKWGGA